MTGDNAHFFDGVDPDSMGDSVMASIVYKTIESNAFGFIRCFSSIRYDMRSGEPVRLCRETSQGSAVTLKWIRGKASDSLIVYTKLTTGVKLVTSGAVSDASVVQINPTGK